MAVQAGSSNAASAFAETGMAETVKRLGDEVRELYLWDSVPWVVGYSGGKEAGRWELETAGAPAVAKATVDRTQFAANGQDLAYVTIELFDASGTPIYARGDDRRVKVRVVGAGRLAGLGNGNPQDVSSLQSGDRMTFHGRAVAVVQAGTKAGDLFVEIEVEGLPGQRIRLSAISQH